MIRAIEQEAGNTKERLAEKRSRDAAGNLIVARGRRGFAGDFPQRTAGKRVSHRRPVAEAVRPRDPVIHRTLIGMQELIDLEWVVVDHPRAAKIAADRRRRHPVGGGIDEQPSNEIDSRVHRDDLDCRNDVAFVAGPARRTGGVQSARERGNKCPDVRRGHPPGGAPSVPSERFWTGYKPGPGARDKMRG